MISKVEVSGLELTITFAEPRMEDIDINVLWNRTIAHIERTRGSVEQALDAAVKRYHS